MSRKTVAILLVMAMGLALMAGCAQQGEESTYPDRHISFIVPWGPGGSGDVESRLLASIVGRHLPKPIVVENKPGGPGTTGAFELAAAKPDGYTVGYLSLPQLVVTQYTSVKPTDVDAYEWIVGWAQYPYTLVVSADSPYESLEELVAKAKDDSMTIKSSGTGVGGTSHMCGAWFAKEAGVELEHIPYDSFAYAAAALLGQEVDLAVLPPVDARPLLEDGQARILAVTGPERCSAFPDVPTLLELGYDVNYVSMANLAAPKGTPDEILQVLEEAYDKALHSEEYADYMERTGGELQELKGDDLLGFIERTDEVHRTLIEELGLQAN